jgi:phage gp36-like protein
MSAYCTQQNLIDRFGMADMQRAVDYAADGELDSDSIDRAINGASGVIDSYVAGLYAVPLVPIPDVARDCCIALTWCRLLGGRDSLTEKWEKECDKWLDWLKDVAAGTAKLPGASAAAGAPQVVYDAQDRIYGRDYRL